MNLSLFPIFYLIYQLTLTDLVDAGAVPLSRTNIDIILKDYEYVLVNFYANWCRFSQMLEPVFDEAADKFAGKKALLAKVDCDTETEISNRFRVNKYPTLKIFRNGEMAKKEYRGQRTVDAFVEFVNKETIDPISYVTSLNDIVSPDLKKGKIIAYVENTNTPAAITFKKISHILRDDCHTFMVSSPLSDPYRKNGDTIIFQPKKTSAISNNVVYSGSFQDFNQLKDWAYYLCVPLVREITFENAEGLTEEGLPFLILFHHLDDTNIVKNYEKMVSSELVEERRLINILHADGTKFSHPLMHLGKTTRDLPLIAIDSFRHMYLFPDIKRLTVPGELKRFIQDLHSGKLHREFHHGPDPVTEAPQKQLAGGQAPSSKKVKSKDPPESSFVLLAPSPTRYSFRDEL
ncbi:hypothetical protein SNEBB_009227 [Seison nebaliae]|nr:hypothetical protein SNEBB_009227 [Seison nebaliae]